ncbi:hypothetical protein AB0M39_40135 [Streptomyces sp. NPDC051907]|uniref:hypothetical protein n=1 Tax=Streptomyces sp. NPDC051907 TaxID=3155284 RepID=UPI0034402195
MSTRFVIARPDEADPAKWTGVYGDADGMPTGAGKHLYAHVVTRFSGDPRLAAEFFIDEHSAGWSFLAESFGRSECYCHDHGEPEAPARETETGAGGMDWTYVLRPEGLEVRRWDYGVAALVPWGRERTDWEAIEAKGYALPR